MAGELFGNGHSGGNEGQDWNVLNSEHMTPTPPSDMIDQPMASPSSSPDFGDEQGGVNQIENVSAREFTPEASVLGYGAEEFFKQRFPDISEVARETRVEHAIQAGLSRMDGMKELQRNFLASRGETLPEDYNEQLLDGMNLEMGRVLANLYDDKSRLVDEIEGEQLGPNEEIAWDVAMEPHKPGTLSLTDLFMNNPQHEGETTEDYKQRLRNYRKQDLARDKQLAEDAAYVEAHPETAKEHHELQGMRFNMELRRQYPGAWEAMEESMRKPEEKVEETEKAEQTEKGSSLEGMSLMDLRDETAARLSTCEDPDMRVRLAVMLGRLNGRLEQMALSEAEAEVAEATA